MGIKAIPPELHSRWAASGVGWAEAGQWDSRPTLVGLPSLAITEDWHAELWLDDADAIGLCMTVWDTLRDSAVYGSEAHRLIARARSALTES